MIGAVPLGFNANQSHTKSFIFGFPSFFQVPSAQHNQFWRWPTGLTYVTSLRSNLANSPQISEIFGTLCLLRKKNFHLECKNPSCGHAVEKLCPQEAIYGIEFVPACFLHLPLSASKDHMQQNPDSGESNRPLTPTLLSIITKISGSFFHPQPPSLLILLSEPGSERKVLTKETWLPLVREC